MANWRHSTSRAHTAWLRPIFAIVLASAGCAAPPPPMAQRVLAHGAAADAGGTLLLVDVCLNYSAMGTGDYFVIAEARKGAEALQAATRTFLEAVDMRARTELIPFVCGALHDPVNAPKRVADGIGHPIDMRPQPLWVAPNLAADTAYVDALQTLATGLFRHSVAANGKEKSSGSVSPTDDGHARSAAALVAERSGRSSLLYLGVTGHSLSPGMATATGIARVMAGVALSVAVGPVFTAGGTQYGVVFVPGGPADKRRMAAALYDLKQSRIVRSGVIEGGGDPTKPEVIAEQDGLTLLLRDLLLSPAP